MNIQATFSLLHLYDFHCIVTSCGQDQLSRDVQELLRMLVTTQWIDAVILPGCYVVRSSNTACIDWMCQEYHLHVDPEANLLGGLVLKP